jgi:metallopeptidase MepB
MSSVSTPKSPLEAPFRFEDLTPRRVLAETEEVINATAALHDRLVTAFTPESATFANVVRPIVDNENQAACRLVILSELLSQLSPSLEVRQAAQQAKIRITAAQTRNLMRHDVAALVFAVYARESSTPSGDLDAQDGHLLSSIRGKYLRSGAGLHIDAERERFCVASDELSQICTAAQYTFIEPEEGVWFGCAELAGVPDAILATMVEDGTRIQVTFRKNHIAAVLSYATSSKTRRRYTIANWHRLPENVERLATAVALRDEIARLLGFEHHAALKMESRMGLSVAYVEAQLEDLHKGLKPVAQAETDRLLKLKRKYPTNDDDPAGELYEWDKAYYGQKQKKDSLSVDYSVLAEYFEARHTLQAMLTLFHDLFGMDFQPNETSVWHDSVIPYQVWDTPSEGGEFLRYLYVDLFEREGKYRGAHCIAIQPVSLLRRLISHVPKD